LGSDVKKSQAVPLALTAMMAASLTGCADEPAPDNVGICVDPKTEIRVEDERCDDGSGGGSGLGGFAFLYFGGLNGGARYNVPPVGGSTVGAGGTTVRPPGTTQTRGISKAGGSVFKGSPTVSRGGFGGSSKGGFGS
jgi:hypothetical protein